jgi:sulfate adenylyltransferase subunit 1
MGIKNAIVAINKIDLTGDDEKRYLEIQAEFNDLLPFLNFTNVTYIPISAFTGDNVVCKSVQTRWYKGPTLLELLESTKVGSEKDEPFRFQIQYVIRPKEDVLHDYRGYAGKVLSGVINVKDEISAGSNKITSKIIRIENNLKNVNIAEAGDNVILHLENDIDLSRGDQVSKINEQQPTESKELNAWLTWFDDSPLQQNKIYLIQHNHRTVRAKITDIKSKWNINNWEFTEANEVKLNDIAQVNLKLNAPIFFDYFEDISANGKAILIDENTCNTVGALLFKKEKSHD